MRLHFPLGISSPIEQEVFLAEKKYLDAKKSGAEPSVIKAMREKVYILKAELDAQRRPASKEQFSSGRMYG